MQVARIPTTDRSGWCNFTGTTHAVGATSPAPRMRLVQLHCHCACAWCNFTVIARDTPRESPSRAAFRRRARALSRGFPQGEHLKGGAPCARPWRPFASRREGEGIETPPLDGCRGVARGDAQGRSGTQRTAPTWQLWSVVGSLRVGGYGRLWAVMGGDGTGCRTRREELRTTNRGQRGRWRAAP